jgi:hypothetical protein
LGVRLDLGFLAMSPSKMAENRARQGLQPIAARPFFNRATIKKDF